MLIDRRTLTATYRVSVHTTKCEDDQDFDNKKKFLMKQAECDRHNKAEAFKLPHTKQVIRYLKAKIIV